jgi:hypothetical protein
MRDDSFDERGSAPFSDGSDVVASVSLHPDPLPCGERETDRQFASAT